MDPNYRSMISKDLLSNLHSISYFSSNSQAKIKMSKRKRVSQEINGINARTNINSSLQTTITSRGMMPSNSESDFSLNINRRKRRKPSLQRANDNDDDDEMNQTNFNHYSSCNSSSPVNPCVYSNNNSNNNKRDVYDDSAEELFVKRNLNNNNHSKRTSLTLLTLLFWVILFNYCCQLALSANGCPAVCICKWKSGKQTAECRNQNLNTLPTDIDVETQVLDLSGNKLQVLPRDAFRRVGLLNLQKIFINGSGLRQIDSGAFNELINLVELHLSDNHLTAVPTAALRSTPFLRDLNMAGNPLVHIQNGAFEYVSELVKLDLSRAQLVRIDKNAFSNLRTLSSLKINSNNLTTINNYTVKSLSQLQHLHAIELHENPWNCDCRLHELKTWLENKNVPFREPPICKTPERLEARKFSDLSAAEFACPPRILNDPSDRHVRVHEEENATIVCLYDAVPVTNVRWYSFQRLISNNTIISAHRKFLIFEDRNDRSILMLTNVLEKDSGEFHCVVENPAGFTETNFTLEVLASPPFPFPTLPTAHIIYIAFGLLVLLLLLSMGVLVTFWRKIRARRNHKPPEILATSTPVKPPRLNYDGNSTSPTSQHQIHHNNLPNGFSKNKIDSTTDNPDLILETNNSGSYQETGLEEQSSNSELNWEQQSYRNIGYATEYPPDYGLPIIHENSVYSEHHTPINYYNNTSNLTHSNNTSNSGLVGSGGVGVGVGGSSAVDPVNVASNIGAGSNGSVIIGSGSASVLMSGVWSKNKVGTRIVRAPSARDSPDEGYQEGYCGTDV